MRLETFFEKFELFADAPNAVAKMRELVLELAVRGQLTERSKEDGQSNDWRRFAEHGRAAGAFTQSEAPFSIPRSWLWCSLNDLGDTKPRNSVADSETVAFVPMASIPEKYGRSVSPQARKWADIKKGYTHFADGDVVLAKITPCYENGKSAVMSDLAGGLGAGTTELHVFRPTEKFVRSDYVLIYLKSRGYIERGVPRMTGSAGQKRVPHDFFAESPFPLPPPEEQKRIVAKVNELMAVCDRLEAQQQEREARHVAVARAALSRFAEAPTPANIDFLFHNSYDIATSDLRATIIDLAMQGRLVQHDPADEPADALVVRIAKKKADRIAAKEVRQGKVSRPVTAVDAPRPLPAGWQWTNVDSLCFKVTDGTHFTPRYTETGVRFVSAKDIVGGALVFDRCKHISREEHDQLFRRCNPEYHDIVISKSGSIGSVALVEDRGEFSLFESLALLKFDKECLYPRFMVYALRKACSSLSAGHIRGVGVKHLHLDMLRGLELPLPPLAEQRRIVAKVDQLMALVDQLEAQLIASTAAAERLMDAVVAELTSGRDALAGASGLRRLASGAERKVASV